MNITRLRLSLSIGGAIMAALSALVLSFEALSLAGLYALGVGIFLAISKDWRRIVPGAIAGVIGILAIVGALNLTIGKSGFDSSGLNSSAAALAVTANLLLATWPIWSRHDEMRPWLTWTSIGVAALAIILALVAGDILDDHSAWQALIVGLLSLGAAVPGSILLNAE